jgi:hypothetical protein
MKVFFIAQHVSNVITLIVRSRRLYAGWSSKCYNLHSDTTLLQPNRTSTPVHTETEQYTYIQSPAPGDECNNIRNMLSNKKNFHKVTNLVQFIQLDYRMFLSKRRKLFIQQYGVTSQQIRRCSTSEILCQITNRTTGFPIC